MAMRLNNAAASAAADSTGLRAYINNASTPILKFYTGNVNGTPESVPAGTLLATVTLAAFGAATNGAIASTGGSVAAAASGTAGCWALFRPDGTTKVADGSVAQTSGGDINFDVIIWVAGGTVTMGTFTITVPPA
jgi:hypothetical protein